MELRDEEAAIDEDDDEEGEAATEGGEKKKNSVRTSRATIPSIFAANSKSTMINNDVNREVNLRLIAMFVHS